METATLQTDQPDFASVPNSNWRDQPHAKVLAEVSLPKGNHFMILLTYIISPLQVLQCKKM